MQTIETALSRSLRSAPGEVLPPRTMQPSPSSVVDERPADELLLSALSRLRLLVIRRDEEPLNEAAQNLFYIELLSEFPLDIALEVVNGWPRTSKFWPAWLELEQAIKDRLEDHEQTTKTTLARPIRLIVKEGFVADFADMATSVYQARLGRRFARGEQATIYRQCLAAAASQVDVIGLDGEIVWRVETLRDEMPEYQNFAPSFGKAEAA